MLLADFTDHFVVQVVHPVWCVCVCVWIITVKQKRVATFHVDIWHDVSP